MISAESLNVEAIDCLRLFVEAYRRGACPMGDSDLYNEQPRSVHVDLGLCRRADAVMRAIDAQSLSADK